MLDFNVIKFFGIKTRSGKVLRLHQAGSKLILMGLLGGIVVLLLVDVFFVGVWENLLVLFQRFLKFRLLWLLSFMELYML